MRKAILFMAMAALLGRAEGADTEAAVSGIGAAKCSAFTKAFKESPTLAENLYFSWAQGYMSGMNTALLMVKKPFRDLSAQSADQQKLHIRNYCDKRPDSPFLDAVLNLYGIIPPQSN